MEGLTTRETIAKELSEAHWAWVRPLLTHTGIGEREIGLVGYLYLTAFQHGWKHSDEDITGRAS